MKIFNYCILSLFLAANFSFAEDSKKDAHKHSANEKEIEHSDHDDHGAGGAEHGEEGHAHGEDEKAQGKDEHGHGEVEENDQIGPEKGIVEFDEDKGFKLSPEALKNFELKTTQVNSLEALVLDTGVVVHVGQEKNLFRLRDGFFKRIDFIQVSKNGSKITLRSKDLKPGDQIVTQGLGFLRISEIAATGGAPEGHSH